MLLDFRIPAYDRGIPVSLPPPSGPATFPLAFRSSRRSGSIMFILFSLRCNKKNKFGRAFGKRHLLIPARGDCTLSSPAFSIQKSVPSPRRTRSPIFQHVLNSIRIADISLPRIDRATSSVFLSILSDLVIRFPPPIYPLLRVTRFSTEVLEPT